MMIKNVGSNSFEHYLKEGQGIISSGSSFFFQNSIKIIRVKVGFFISNLEALDLKAH